MFEIELGIHTLHDTFLVSYLLCDFEAVSLSLKIQNIYSNLRGCVHLFLGVMHWIDEVKIISGTKFRNATLSVNPL